MVYYVKVGRRGADDRVVEGSVPGDVCTGPTCGEYHLGSALVAEGLVIIQVR